MAFSSIAAMVNDYAVTEAKRAGAPKITQVHLLLAISRFREERFDSEYPGLADSLREQVSAAKGGALKPEGYDNELEAQLEGVRSEEDLWAWASDLVGGAGINAGNVQQQLPLDGNAKQQSSPPLEGAEGSKAPEQQSSPPATPEESFPLNAAFVTRIAGLLKVEPARASLRVAADVSWIANSIASSPIDGLDELVCTALEVESAEVVIYGDLSDFVVQLVAVKSAESSDAARELALTYVAVATWAAAVDDNVDDAEVERIDELRLRLRGDLDGAVASEDPELDIFGRVFAQLIGMEPVKAELRKRIDFYVVNQRRRARGLTCSSHSMHMAFLGNPGTGKTEVARLYSQVLREMGLLSGGQLVEVDRSGLVGQYVGQTEKRTSDVVRRAVGGVLFIDEAYALANDVGSQNGYGQEIIDVLVKELEDKRDDLVTIFAGYERPMELFFETNEGLRSRVPTTITFDDYATEELVEIAQLIVLNDGYCLSPNAADKIREGIDNAREKPGFGNARTVRNLCESALRNQSARIASLGDLATSAELREVTEIDVPEPEPLEVAEERTIGFSRRKISD